MTHAEALAAAGLPPDAPSVWPTCGCSDDEDDPDCGGSGDPSTCCGPRHAALRHLGPRPDRRHDFDGNDPVDWSEPWCDPCRCPCHGGAS